MINTARVAASGPSPRSCCKSSPWISRIGDEQASIDFAELINRHYMGFVQSGGSSGLPTESLPGTSRRRLSR